MSDYFFLVKVQDYKTRYLALRLRYDIMVYIAIYDYLEKHKWDDFNSINRMITFFQTFSSL
jgi:hypothetical protein